MDSCFGLEMEIRSISCLLLSGGLPRSLKNFEDHVLICRLFKVLIQPSFHLKALNLSTYSIENRTLLAFHLQIENPIPNNHDREHKLYKLGPLDPCGSGIFEFRPPSIGLLEMELVFWMEGGEIGWPLLTRAVRIVDYIEGSGNEWGRLRFPAKDRFDGGPDVEWLSGANLGGAVCGGGEGASREGLL